MESKPTNNRSRLAFNLLNILNKSYKTKPTVTARPKGTGVRFSDTISIATPIENNHHILKEGLERMQTKYKNTRGKVRNIYPSLVRYDTEKKKKRKKKEVSMSTFVRKRILSALPRIAAQRTTTRIDPVTKTVYGTIQIGVANNIYDKLFNDDDTKPTVYKTSCLFDSAASGHYADNKTVVLNYKVAECMKRSS